MLRRGLLVLLTGAAVAGVVVAPAQAATAGPRGAIGSVVQDSFTHRVTVRGWAYDPHRPGASIVVRVYVGRTYVGSSRADLTSPVINQRYRVSGRHRYTVTFRRTATLAAVHARTRGVYTSRPLVPVGTHTVVHVSTGARIIAVAKRFVGKARYRDGGATPARGFDCSGYTKYVYSAAGAGTLPHNADAQRRMARMHRVSAARARPGDLVFYQSGGHSYHVAIYAGRHRQYAAATVRDGIRYQPIWSSSVVYGHLS